jgi:dCMP deaminase
MERRVTPSKRRSDFKIRQFFKILEQIAILSNASTTKVACMALKKDFTKIASFGYNGSYMGAPINPITGTEEESLEPGCSGFIHAEVNMISKFREVDPENYMILLTLSPCKMCTKILVNSGFKHVYWLETYRETEHLSIFDECGITYGDKESLKKDYISKIF